MYAATGGGLSISTNGGSSFTNYTTTAGLGSIVVRGVFASGGRVYAATTGGLSINLPSPTVTSIFPSFGSTAGGDTITITGTGFLMGATVTVGGVACTSPTVVSATSITCSTGAHAAGAVNVVVTNTDAQSGTGANQFTYVVPVSAPSATTNAASSVTASDATLNGTIDDNGASATVTFNYGTTASYGSTATAVPSLISAGAGSTSVSATLAGLTCNTTYHYRVSATSSAGTTNGSDQSFSTSLCPQTTFANPGSQNFGTTPTLTATASSGLTPTFTSSTTGVCSTTSGGTLTFVTTGSCTINADQAGNSSYGAAPQVSQSFTVNAVVPSAPSIGTATAGNTQASVTFTTPSSNGGDSISGYTVTSSPGGLTGTGSASPITVTGLTNGTTYTFTVTATNSAGTGSASSASNPVTPKATQTITFANPGSQNFGTTPTLTATASSGLTPTFTSSTTGVCSTTSGGTLTFVTTGSCTINADQAGNSSYGAAPQVSQSFTVNAVVPVLSIGNSPQTYTGSPIAATVNCSSSGAVSNVKYNSSSTVPTNAGTYAVTADCASNGNYSALTAAAAGNLVIDMAAQSALVVISTPPSLNVNTSSTLTTTGGSGNGAVSYILVSGPCTLLAGTAMLTGTGAGSCVVTATKEANGNYTSVTSAPFTVTVAGPPPVLNLVATVGPGYIKLDFSSSLATATTSKVQATSSVTYTGTCVSSDGGVTASATGPSSPLTVTGVTAGKSYTCTVIGTDGSGSSVPSNPSNAVTPLPAPTPPAPIPTLSEWAQNMMIFCMIATAGFYGCRMKQR